MTPGLFLKRQSSLDARREEIAILDSFSWNLCVVTLFDLVKSFFAKGVLLEGDSYYTSLDCENDIKYSETRISVDSRDENVCTATELEPSINMSHSSIYMQKQTKTCEKLLVRNMEPYQILNLIDQISLDCEMLIGIVNRYLAVRDNCLEKAAFYIVLLARTMAGLTEEK